MNPTLSTETIKVRTDIYDTYEDYQEACADAGTEPVSRLEYEGGY
jgi:hypothetical protein